MIVPRGSIRVTEPKEREVSMKELIRIIPIPIFNVGNGYNGDDEYSMQRYVKKSPFSHDLEMMDNSTVNHFLTKLLVKQLEMENMMIFIAIGRILIH